MYVARLTSLPCPGRPSRRAWHVARARGPALGMASQGRRRRTPTRIALCAPPRNAARGAACAAPDPGIYRARAASPGASRKLCQGTPPVSCSACAVYAPSCRAWPQACTTSKSMQIHEPCRCASQTAAFLRNSACPRRPATRCCWGPTSAQHPLPRSLYVPCLMQLELSADVTDTDARFGRVPPASAPLQAPTHSDKVLPALTTDATSPLEVPSSNVHISSDSQDSWATPPELSSPSHRVGLQN